MLFPVSGVEVFPLIPPLVAFAISLFTSMGGISGAFLLLPFQVSVLGFTSPAVSPTNLTYNIFAIPGGVYRYFREKRMVWPLVGVITAGLLPGIGAGAVVRVALLPDSRTFKLLVGILLFYLAVRTIQDALKRESSRKQANPLNGAPAAALVTIRRLSWKSIEYGFNGEVHAFRTAPLFILSLIVGVVSGVYGIGGGAIMAPFLVSWFRLPIHTVAGATLTCTFLASVVGVAFFTLVAPAFAANGLAVAPDWMLGALFGLGGLAGTYCGARLQKRIPARAIKAILAVSLTVIAGRYVVGFFF
jgi:uncharacterized membrane protein YfcA